MIILQVEGGGLVETKDSEERRNEFVDVAEKLFKENGIVDTTVNAIVKELDVAKGLFYYYFKSKDDVIDAISAKYNEIFLEMMNEEMDAQPTYEEKLNQFVENCIESFQRLRENLHGDHDDVDLMALKVKSLEEAKEKASQSLKDLFQEGIEQGKLHIKNSTYYADIIVSGISDLVKTGEASTSEIKEIMMDLIQPSRKEDKHE